MNVFVQKLPDNVTYHEVHRTFDRPLRQCGVKRFHIDKHRNKGNATITILDPKAGQDFLQTYGTPNGKPKLPLRYNNQQLRIVRDRNEPTDWALRALAYEQTAEEHKLPPPPTSQAHAGHARDEFACDSLQVGNWEYAKDSRSRNEPKLIFTSYYAKYTEGRVIFGRREAKIILGGGNSIQHRIDIPYHDCREIILGNSTEPTVSFTLHIPPKLYEVDPSEAQGELQALLREMEAMTLNQPIPQFNSRQQAGKKYRVAAIDPQHACVVGHCFVYRIPLLDRSKLSRIRDIVYRSEKCTVLSLQTAVTAPKEPMDKAFTRLNHQLADQGLFGKHPFQLRYQVDRLARNGFLPPEKVIALLPHISRTFKVVGLDQTVAGLRQLSRNLPLPGPDTQAQDFSLGALEEMLDEYVACYDGNAPDNPYELSKRYEHINLIHRVVVTPTHVWLDGPEPEPTNRVLRLHAQNTDRFLRVVFQDEDGGRVKFDWSSNYERIYHKRFKGILDAGISIAGLGFSFLGFSHSSLRSQSCWFMAPYIKDGTLQFAEMVIKNLGKFSDIRIPAKCAARIGQNFTDTNTSVTLLKEQVFELPEVVRNGHDFADGAGTISPGLLKEVWKVYGTRRMLKPTALQIRFQGAKGMVAMDPRLQGKLLGVRKNMRKYETGDEHMNLEICGAAFRPLPMILNRGFIKILEDLGVPVASFMDLQNAAMRRLRLMTQSAINTGTLLDEVHTSKASGLPTLIRYLGQIGMDYHFEPFLYAAVELAVISELRDIKHRGRIPVPKGVTLFGLPDETGTLREGEIFVITERAPEGGKKVEVRNNVIITRSPALHPGDIQVVNAVDVPLNNPLRQLSNVVVFSKWGRRDLPSKLAGGDLDGDLYNVIWDETLIPTHIHIPAEYPRLAPKELPREVTRKDMSDFFVTFMENDKLGMISNQHLQLADQRPHGTLDRDCIQLAALASTAVDYSKTGIPADMSTAPKPAKFKPDYMAPTPRVLFSQQGLLDLEEEDDEPDEAFDSIDAERRPMRYYESRKALGILYRNIDERQFLSEMQKSHRLAAGSNAQCGLLKQLLDYVVHTATVVYGGNLYKHHKVLAREIRNSYEESLTNLMCDCEPTPHKPLSEIEVFAGQILGRKNGPDGKMLRELGDVMRGRFEKIVDYANMRITYGDDMMEEVNDLDDLYGEEYSDREMEALPRAIACLEVAVKERGYEDRTVGELISFKYIAATAALKELDRWRVTTNQSYAGLPPLSSM